MARTRLEHGTTPAGRSVPLFVLENAHGMEARVSAFGARLTRLTCPDAAGALADITLGYETLGAWMADEAAMGATVGRFANRIRDARFTLDGETHELSRNHGRHHLHGGFAGFHHRLWRETDPGRNDAAVALAYESADGEEGYPGRLAVTVVYALTDAPALEIEMTATTDAPTLVNLAHHTYWNLVADPARGVLGHEAQIEAARFLPVDGETLPTGEIRPVEHTPWDFRAPKPIGRDLEAAGTYDHNYCLADAAGELRRAARLRDPGSGRALTLWTDQPGLQFYAGGNLDGTIRGKDGATYREHAGVCLESQGWPDAPSHPHFPSPVLRPGQTYRHRMVHELEPGSPGSATR